MPVRTQLTRKLGRIEQLKPVTEAKPERAAFAELARQYEGQVLRLALHVTAREDKAMAIYVDTFLAAQARIAAFEFEHTSQTWMLGIAAGFCLEFLEREQGGDQAARENSVAANWLEDAFRRLSPRERMAFELKHYHNLRLGVVAKILNVADDTAKTLLKSSTEKLLRCSHCASRLHALYDHQPGGTR